MLVASTLTTVRDTLISSALSEVLPKNVIQVTRNERPWPNAGEWFVAVYPSMLFNTDTRGQVRRRKLNFNVVVTRRLRDVPPDRLDQELYLRLLTSMSSITSIIVEVLDSNYSIYSNIYTNYISNISNYPSTVKALFQNFQFTDACPKFLDCDIDPIERYPEFFSAKDGVETMSERPAGYSMGVRFSGPEMIANISC